MTSFEGAASQRQQGCHIYVLKDLKRQAALVSLVGCTLQGLRAGALTHPTLSGSYSPARLGAAAMDPCTYELRLAEPVCFPTLC
jgi:hypothetical protein